MRGTSSFQLFPLDPPPRIRCSSDLIQTFSDDEDILNFSFTIDSTGEYGQGSSLHFTGPFDQMGELLSQIKSEYDAMSVQRADETNLQPEGDLTDICALCGLIRDCPDRFA